MSIDILFKIIGILVILLLITYGRKEYWRGKCAGHDTNFSEDYLNEENRFWRRHLNKEAAEAAEEHF